jgi:hypothetical protein
VAASSLHPPPAPRLTRAVAAKAVAELRQEMEERKESLRRLFQSLLQQASAQGGSTQALSRAGSQNSVRSADAREEPVLSLEQLHRVLAKMGLRREEHAEVRAIFRDMDLDGSGGISFGVPRLYAAHHQRRVAAGQHRVPRADGARGRAQL